MAKKSFNVGDLVSFHHWDFDHKVHGIIKELCPNNMIAVAYKHPKHGYQLLGLHTSAIQVVDLSNLSNELRESFKQTIYDHDHALHLLSR